MTASESTSAGGPSPGGEAPAGDAGPAGYEGPGGWGTAAMVLLIGLFLISVGLTVHSLVATFGA